jgi:hypothetical protein
MQRALLPLVLAVLLLASAAPSVRAAEEWCEVDPLVVVTTPGGHAVPLFVTSGALGVEHLTTLQLARITYTATPLPGNAATLVGIAVLVPDDLFASGFPVRSAVSSGPLKTGMVYASAEGVSGKHLHMAFRLDVP